MKQTLTLLLFAGIFFGCKKETQTDATDRVVHYEAFESQHVQPRNVDVWLPAGYETDAERRFAVLYMHDGQNLFDSTTAFGGEEWKVDETIQQYRDSIKDCIVVGIWNTNLRFLEYAPEKAYLRLPEPVRDSLAAEFGSAPMSDAYLQFIVEELKPFIDENYRTLPDRENTFMMGSSMGGLVSAYAICEYPSVFGGVACMSTHWVGSLQREYPEIPNAIQAYLAENLPDPANHNIYFDYGTETLDSLYEPHQLVVDSIVRARGYERGENWQTHKFEGAAHAEPSWRARFHEPLLFLLGK